MADKTTTLKTKTNDNVYPNVIGDNRDNAISDSPQIKHTLTAEHKINFRLDTNVNNLINNSLQKPAGLTKTELVGVGANGQENIEIGDNLTLANGKLSATGGGSGGSLYLEATYDFDSMTGSYTGTISDNTTGIHISNLGFFPFSYILDGTGFIYYISEVSTHLNIDTLICYDNTIIGDNTKVFQGRTFFHFITMTNSNDVALYLTIQNTDKTVFTSNSLASYLVGKKVLANGNLHGVVPTYIAGEGGVIKIYYRTPGDNNINPTPDEYQDLSSFTITDLVSPVD